MPLALLDEEAPRGNLSLGLAADEDSGTVCRVAVRRS
jgi:hypothetical protein